MIEQQKQDESNADLTDIEFYNVQHCNRLSNYI